MTTATVTPEIKKQESILEAATFLVLTRERIQLSKTLPKERVKTEVKDPKRISSNKSLYDCVELKQLLALDGRIDGFIRSRCLPFPLKNGIYLLPKKLYSEVETELKSHKLAFDFAVQRFIDVFDQAVESSRESLGNEFNAKDYPTTEQVKNDFKFSWTYMKFGVDEQLKEADKKVYEEQAAQWESTVKDAGDSIRQMLRASMSDLVNHLCERLSPTIKDGEKKKKAFHTSSIEKMNDFLSVFSARNLTGDTDLQGLAERAKQLVSGISVENLRSDDSLREAIKVGFEGIKKELDPLVLEKPSRSIRFEV